MLPGRDGHLLAPTLAALPQPARRAIDLLAGAAFRAVQIDALHAPCTPNDLDSGGRRDLLATLRRRELTLAGVDWWPAPSIFADEALVDRAVVEGGRALALAEDLGRCPVSTSLPADGSSLAADVRSTLAADALRRGVTLVDFRVPPTSSDDVAVGIDPAALLGAGEDPAAACLAAGRIGGVRLVDLKRSGTRGAPGDPMDGRLDVPALRAALDVIGYDGAVVIDARQWHDPWHEMQRARACWLQASPGAGL